MKKEKDDIDLDDIEEFRIKHIVSPKVYKT